MCIKVTNLFNIVTGVLASDKTQSNFQVPIACKCHECLFGAGLDGPMSRFANPSSSLALALYFLVWFKADKSS